MGMTMSKLAKVTTFSECDSVESMLEQSNTNWDIQVVTANSPGHYDSGGYKALVRPDSNTALAFVSERFRPNSHRQQLAGLDTFIRNGDLVPVTCSVWDNGAILAYQLRAPMLDVVIQGKDVVSPLLTMVFGYGFKIADSAFFADFRWFCKNQMGTVSKLMTDRVRHRANVFTNYQDVLGKRLTELSGELSGHYDSMRRMLDKRLVGRPLYDYFGKAIGVEQEQVDMAWVSSPEDIRGPASAIPDILVCHAEDNGGAEGTVWHAYNAVTRYETHKHGHNAASRQRRMLLGAGAGVANRAFDIAAELAAGLV
jgi:hypothetical protein